jgi:hypothetical protein
VIQGSNDTRCPPKQMVAYEEAMKAAGKVGALSAVSCAEIGNHPELK